MDLIFEVHMQHCSVQHQTFTYTTRNIHNWTFLLLWPRHFILCRAIINSPLLFPSSKLGTFWPGGSFSGVIPFFFFNFSYCSLFSPGENTGVGCHFLLQWIMFCQNSSLWPVWTGRPCMAWLIASLSYMSLHTFTVINERDLHCYLNI